MKRSSLLDSLTHSLTHSFPVSHQVETIFQKGRSTYVPSSTYLTARTESEQDHVSILKAQAQAKALAEAPAVVEPVVGEQNRAGHRETSPLHAT